MKNLTDWFDRVYVINCAHRQDRRDRVMRHLEESRMAELEKVVVYPAIVGAWTTAPHGWLAPAGAWGCMRSHARILEDVMHVRDERHATHLLRSVLILEDDVFFTEGALEKLNAFMSEVPEDWGQIYLGGQHQRKADPTPYASVVIGNSVNRTHAYAVSSDYYQKVYRHISYMKDYEGKPWHIDHQMERAHRRKDWPTYCPAQWIAGQDAGMSDVMGGEEKRRIW